MNKFDDYLKTMARLNDHWSAEAKPLEKQLRELEKQYKDAAARASVDAKAAASLTSLEARINEVTKKLNDVYYQWSTNARMIAPPPESEMPKDWTEKIPFPDWVPAGLRKWIVQSIKQKGLAITKKITIKKGPGKYGAALEIVW
jgi:hypothetical protein